MLLCLHHGRHCSEFHCRKFLVSGASALHRGLYQKRAWPLGYEGYFPNHFTLSEQKALQQVRELLLLHLVSALRKSSSHMCLFLCLAILRSFRRNQQHWPFGCMWPPTAWEGSLLGSSKNMGHKWDLSSLFCGGGVSSSEGGARPVGSFLSASE